MSQRFCLQRFAFHTLLLLAIFPISASFAELDRQTQRWLKHIEYKRTFSEKDQRRLDEYFNTLELKDLTTLVDHLVAILPESTSKQLRQKLNVHRRRVVHLEASRLSRLRSPNSNHSALNRNGTNSRHEGPASVDPSEAQQSTSIYDLPNEMLVHLIQFLEPADRGRLAQTGSLLSDVLSDPRIQEEIRLFRLDLPFKFEREIIHPGPLNSVALSSDGSLAASAGNSNEVLIWDVQSGTVVKTIQEQSQKVDFVTFSPKEQKLAVIAEENAAIWYLESSEPSRIPVVPGQKVTAVQFSPDGTMLALATQNSIIFWDVRTSTPIHELRSLSRDFYSDKITSMAFDENQTTFGVVGDRQVFVWDLNSMQQILAQHWSGSSITSIAFSPGGSEVILGDLDCAIKVFSLDLGRPTDSLTGHRAGIDSVAYSPNGNQFVSASHDGTIKIWNAEEKKEIITIDAVTPNQLQDSPFTRSSRLGLAAIATPDHKIQIYRTKRIGNRDTTKLIRTLDGHTSPIVRLRLSPNGKKLASLSSDHTLKIWTLETGKKSIEVATKHKTSVHRMRFSPGGAFLATGSLDRVQAWNVNSGKLIKNTVVDSTRPYKVRFSPKGEPVIHEPSQDSLRRERKAFVAFSANGLRLISGSSHSMIKIYWR